MESLIFCQDAKKEIPVCSQIWEGTMKRGAPLSFLLGVVLSCSAIRADTILVANLGADTIGEYTTSGSTLNASLVSGLSSPGSIAVSGFNFFVVNESPTNTIGEYTTSGGTVNASLISSVTNPHQITVS